MSGLKKIVTHSDDKDVEIYDYDVEMEGKYKTQDERINYPLPCYMVNIFGKYLDDNFDMWKDIFKSQKIVSGDFEITFNCEVKKYEKKKSRKALKAFILLHDKTSGENNAAKGRYGSGENMKFNLSPGTVLITPNIFKNATRDPGPSDIADLLHTVINAAVIGFNVDPRKVFLLAYKESTKDVYNLISLMSDFFAGIGVLGHKSLNNFDLLHLQHLSCWVFPLKSENEFGELYYRKVVEEINYAIRWLSFQSRKFGQSIIKLGSHLSPVMRHSYWLEIGDDTLNPAASLEGELETRYRVNITSRNVRKAIIKLNYSLIDLLGNFKVIINGNEVFTGPIEENAELAKKYLEANRDPFLVYFFSKEFDIFF